MSRALIILFVLLSGTGNCDMEWKPEDETEWVDPGDMLHYDPVSQTMKSGGTNPSDDKTNNEAGLNEVLPTCTNNHVASNADLSNCNAEKTALAESFKTLKSQCEAWKELPFFKQFVKVVLNRYKRFEDSQSKDLGDSGHYEVDVVISPAQYKYLQDFTENNKGTIQEVHSILTNMMSNHRWIKYSDLPPPEELWFIKDFKDNFNLIFKILAATACALHGIWLLSKIRISASRLIFCLALASFMLSVPWTWWHLYKQALVKKLVNIDKGVPDSCRGQKQSFLNWIGSLMKIGPDECSKYYENLEINPFWEVPPTKALAVTMTRFFVEPFEHIGEAVRKLLLSLLEGVPFYLYPLMIVFLIVILLLPLLVFRDYRIRSWLFSIEPSHPSDNSEARTLQKQLESQKVKTRELKAKLEELQSHPSLTNSITNQGAGDSSRARSNCSITACSQDEVKAVTFSTQWVDSRDGSSKSIQKEDRVVISSTSANQLTGNVSNCKDETSDDLTNRSS